MSVRSSAAIERVASPVSFESILRAVAKAVEAASGSRPLIRPGDRVLIKPNIFAPHPAPTTTDPRVVAALVRLALEAGAGEVIVGEGRSISTAKFRKSHNTTRGCAEIVGMTSAVETAGGRMVFFEEDEFVEVDVPGGVILERARAARTVMDADVLINVPVLKIHSLTLVTLGIKNLHGVISDEDKLFGHSYHTLPTKLTDFLRVRTPDMTVIDGIVGQEADHAEEGRPVEMGLIVAGGDVVAVDAVASAVIGLDPMEVDTTRIAHEQRLGIADLSSIEVLGESVESVRRPFARPDIALDPELFPGVRIVAGDYCRSCQYYTRRGLDNLVEEGLLGGDRELTIILGKEPPAPYRLSGKVIMLGDCCLASESIRRLRDYLLLDGRLQTVYACPPMQFRMRAVQMVED